MAAGATYTPIASTTIGTAVASYTFSSIPATYTDLVLIVNNKLVSGSASLRIQFNGDTATNYSGTQLYGYGSSASSGRETSTATPYMGSESTGWGTHNLNIFSYANTSVYKTWTYRSGDVGVGIVEAGVYLWRSTAAITSIKLFDNSANNFDVGSTFALYGIAAA